MTWFSSFWTFIYDLFIFSGDRQWWKTVPISYYGINSAVSNAKNPQHNVKHLTSTLPFNVLLGIIVSNIFISIYYLVTPWSFSQLAKGTRNWKEERIEGPCICLLLLLLGLIFNHHCLLCYTKYKKKLLVFFYTKCVLFWS